MGGNGVPFFIEQSLLLDLINKAVFPCGESNVLEATSHPCNEPLLLFQAPLAQVTELLKRYPQDCSLALPLESKGAKGCAICLVASWFCELGICQLVGWLIWMAGELDGYRVACLAAFLFHFLGWPKLAPTSNPAWTPAAIEF